MNIITTALLTLVSIGGVATAGVAAIQKEDKTKNEDDSVEKITNALNRATSVFLTETDTYILNVSKLREYGGGYIDMHLCNKYMYAPIDTVFAVNDSARTYVSDITDKMFFDAMTVASNNGGVTRYLLYLLIAGNWVFVGSPYDYDKAYTQSAHRIVWDCHHTIKEDNHATRGKCRVI